MDVHVDLAVDDVDDSSVRGDDERRALHLQQVEGALHAVLFGDVAADVGEQGLDQRPGALGAL